MIMDPLCYMDYIQQCMGLFKGCFYICQEPGYMGSARLAAADVPSYNVCSFK